MTSLKMKLTSVLFYRNMIHGKRNGRVRVMVGFKCFFTVESDGGKRGLAFMWDESIDINIKSFSKGHIDAEVKGSRNAEQRRFTGFYGHPDQKRRIESRQLLKNLAGQWSRPWICIGDFNQILRQTEKGGGCVRADGHIRAFRETLKEFQLVDLGFKGTEFTWNNGRKGKEFIKARLDRGQLGIGIGIGFFLKPYVRETGQGPEEECDKIPGNVGQTPKLQDGYKQSLELDGQ
ncbi:Exo_endo_phos domain-containing protein [Cephalotus follicularis]|uniref:Exo_endo_phos domain-containing protein n=1 Tax=Cephalotus follicularis TaxID=3775 RepID=A0A1Q3BDG5_CEPFO|nr:Exo_endo_phos domain-containing protein [Cephalotus follicularis]